MDERHSTRWRARSPAWRGGAVRRRARAAAGLYDDSGKWLSATGLPAKSGVGGGIIAVAPGKFGIAAIAPPLDAAGNSVKAQKAVADVSNALGGNPYASQPHVAKKK